MAAVTVAARGDAGYVDPNQRVVSRGWISGTLQTSFVPQTTVGARTLYVTIATDGDTLTVANWNHGVPQVRCLADTEDTAVTAYPTVSGTTLTVTFQTDAALAAYVEIGPGGALAAA